MTWSLEALEVAIDVALEAAFPAERIELERALSTAAAFEDAGAIVELEVHDDREHHVSDRAVAGLRRLFARA